MKRDQYEKNIIKKCSVCNQQIFVDQFENGKCINCGWEQFNDAVEFSDKIRYPNLVSLNKAKKLYKQGKKFIPTLEDFAEGLFFYSEMQFEYKNRKFGVVLRKGKQIEFYEFNKMFGFQVYATKEEFMANAHIEGTSLSELWDNVENANYMQ